MSYNQIRNQVADQIALQDSMKNKIGPRWIPPSPEELFTADEHTKVHLPRLEAQNFDHSIVVASPAELAHVFDAASELAGGYYVRKDATIEHEVQHGEAAERLGQKGVRFLARLAVSAPFSLPGGRQMRNISIEPFTLLEDVDASRLGVALFLGAPENTADTVEDTKQIQALGYTDANEAIRRAADFNTRTRSNTYPLPRRTA